MHVANLTLHKLRTSGWRIEPVAAACIEAYSHITPEPRRTYALRYHMVKPGMRWDDMGPLSRRRTSERCPVSAIVRTALEFTVAPVLIYTRTFRYRGRRFVLELATEQTQRWIRAVAVDGVWFDNEPWLATVVYDEPQLETPSALFI